MDQKFQEFHKRLDDFELRVLERPSLTSDMYYFCIELASVQADVDAILSTPAIKPQASPFALGNDTVLGYII